VAELEAQQVQATAAEQALVASAVEAESAVPIELSVLEPVMPAPEVIPDAPLVAVPNLPVIIVTEVRGRGRHAAARAVDGDIPPNSQLGFGWLLTSYPPSVPRK